MKAVVAVRGRVGSTPIKLPVVIAILVQITSARVVAASCADATALANARAQVDGQCACATARSHGTYVRCAARVAKAAVDAGALPPECQGAVKECAAHSTCGKPGAVACCFTAFIGNVTATDCKIARDEAHCVHLANKSGAALCPSHSGSCCDCETAHLTDNNSCNPPPNQVCLACSPSGGFLDATDRPH